MKALAKSLIVGGVVGAVGLGSLAGAGIVGAESQTGATDPNASLVEKLASTFNLNKDEVQKVFDQDRSEKEEKREAQVGERLQKLVDDGTITAAQKTAIEAKLTELKSERNAEKENWKSLSPEERKAKMDEKRSNLEQWAKEQGIDLSKLRGIFGGHGHGGPGGPR